MFGPELIDQFKPSKTRAQRSFFALLAANAPLAANFRKCDFSSASERACFLADFLLLNSLQKGVV